MDDIKQFSTQAEAVTIKLFSILLPIFMFLKIRGKLSKVKDEAGKYKLK
jgi:hypothetical protein